MGLMNVGIKIPEIGVSTLQQCGSGRLLGQCGALQMQAIASSQLKHLLIKQTLLIACAQQI